MIAFLTGTGVMRGPGMLENGVELLVCMRPGTLKREFRHFSPSFFFPCCPDLRQVTPARMQKLDGKPSAQAAAGGWPACCLHSATSFSVQASRAGGFGPFRLKQARPGLRSRVLQ